MPTPFSEEFLVPWQVIQAQLEDDLDPKRIALRRRNSGQNSRSAIISCF